MKRKFMYNQYLKFLQHFHFRLLIEANTLTFLLKWQLLRLFLRRYCTDFYQTWWASLHEGALFRVRNIFK